MTPKAAQPGAPTTTATGASTAERMLALGLLPVALGAEGEVRGTLLGPGPVRDFVVSPTVARSLHRMAGAWNDEPTPEPAELWPGAWALPLPEQHRRRRVGYTVALQLSPDSLRAGQFEAACGAAGLDAGAMRTLLASFAVHPPECAPRMIAALRFIEDDRGARLASNDSLAGFSRQLSESFEEISLLYKLGSSLNQIVQPDRFVHLLCDELHATTAFRWVGVAFAADTAGAKAMAGRLFHAGEASPRALGLAIRRLLVSADTKKERVVSASEMESLGLPSVGETLLQPVAREDRLLAVIVAGDKAGEDPTVSSVDMKLVAAASAYLAIHLENASLYEDQQSMFLGTLKALTASIDAKDRYTRGHSERVAHLTRMLAERAGLNEAELERVHIAGLVHDVGKIGVPEAVLRKPGALTDEEFGLIKQHPEIGHTILKDIPQLADVLPGVLHHHERWDGRGYPHKIAGERIPFVARLIALADSFDAMSSTRTYRPAMPRPKVMDEIARGAGAQFDPSLATLFIALDFGEYDRMVARHVAQDGDAGLAPGVAA